jgi:hypothetical protein
VLKGGKPANSSKANLRTFLFTADLCTVRQIAYLAAA